MNLKRILRLELQARFKQPHTQCTLAEFYARVTPKMIDLLFEPQNLSVKETVKLFQRKFREKKELRP
jgi:hypothetical protein